MRFERSTDAMSKGNLTRGFDTLIPFDDYAGEHRRQPLDRRDDLRLKTTPPPVPVCFPDLLRYQFTQILRWNVLDRENIPY